MTTRELNIWAEKNKCLDDGLYVSDGNGNLVLIKDCYMTIGVVDDKQIIVVKLETK